MVILDGNCEKPFNVWLHSNQHNNFTIDAQGDRTKLMMIEHLTIDLLRIYNNIQKCNNKKNGLLGFSSSDI